MKSANNGKNALRSEAGDGERPGRTPVGSANVRMDNLGGDQPRPINKTGSKENIKCVLKKNLKHIQISVYEKGISCKAFNLQTFIDSNP